MGLVYETLIISVLMALFCVAPRFFRSMRESSQVFLLIGTGALVGIYFFDLLPDVVEIGGRSSLIIVLAVWAVYSLVHSFHLHHHQQEHCELDSHHEAEPSIGVGFLMVSMVAHCLASGMFLSLSRGLSQSIEHTVFWALLAHKGYEALSVSLVLQERVRSARKLAVLTALYALSFPAGVAITVLATQALGGPEHEHWIRAAAVVVASVAAGSLMGCMIHDFVIPSFKQVKTRRSELAWVALGLVGTLAVSAFL
jgi:zinc transporter ZupT